MATTPLSANPQPSLRQRALGLVATDTARMALLALLTILLLGAASLVYLNLAAQVEAASDQLRNLTTQRRALEWQKSARESELAQLTHPDRLETRASELGFRPPRGVTYVPVAPDIDAALARSAGASALAKPKETSTPTGWAGAKARLDRWLGR